MRDSVRLTSTVPHRFVARMTLSEKRESFPPGSGRGRGNSQQIVFASVSFRIQLHSKIKPPVLGFCRYSERAT